MRWDASAVWIGRFSNLCCIFHGVVFRLGRRNAILLCSYESRAGCRQRQKIGLLFCIGQHPFKCPWSANTHSNVRSHADPIDLSRGGTNGKESLIWSSPTNGDWRQGLFGRLEPARGVEREICIPMFFASTIDFSANPPYSASTSTPKSRPPNHLENRRATRSLRRRGPLDGRADRPRSPAWRLSSLALGTLQTHYRQGHQWHLLPGARRRRPANEEGTNEELELGMVDSGSSTMGVI
jgi:hypothetical protein